VPLEEPSWWYDEQPALRRSIATTVLKPLAVLYGMAARRRFIAAKPYVSELPVICIGNFTAGGTGKTPMAIHIAGLLQALGERPVFLSRGFGGALAGPHWVEPGCDRTAQVGDEPLLLAEQAPALIARERMAGAKAIAAAAAAARDPAWRASVIIMDDGLQNPSLHKDLTIAMVDGRRGFGNGLVLPAGPLRAPLAFQLPLADAIIINGAAQDPQIKQHPQIDQGQQIDQDTPNNDGEVIAERLRSQFNGPILNAETIAGSDSAWLTKAPVVAFAGIGAPQRFYRLLASLGADVVETRSFKDHHSYSDGDARILLNTAKARAAQLVTTEKDLVRLSGDGPAMNALKSTSRALPISLQLAPAGEQQLVTLLKSALRKTSPAKVRNAQT